MREYNESLYSKDADDPTKLDAWQEKCNELFNTLLAEMGEYLGYHFEKGILRRQVYNPRGWVENESEQIALRKAAVNVFSGKQSLNITLTSQPIEESKIPPPIGRVGTPPRR